MTLRSILAALRSAPPLPRARAAGRRAGFRLRMEVLEARLALGDALFGPLVSAAWLGAPLSLNAPDLMAPPATRSKGEYQPERPGEFAAEAELAWVAGPADTYRQSDPAEQPTWAPVAAGQVPSWESAGVPPCALPGALSARVGLPVGHPSGHAPALGLTLAQVAGLVHEDSAPGAGERNRLLQVVGTQPQEGEELTADRDDGAGVQSSGVHALFNLDYPNNGPFPSNVFTLPDRTMNTNLRVNLPFSDCKVFVSDCEDLAVLNELDGFNLQPRLSVPFSGPIDVDTATSETVFLVSLGSTVPGQGYMPRGTVVGINQIVWDVETNTLHVESDELLAQHTRFALIVTNGVRDADGDRVEASPEFRRFRETAPPAYRRELEDAIAVARRLGISERQMVTASVFTTQSTTAVLEKIRDQIKAQTPAPADFNIGPDGTRAVFDLDDVAGLTHHQHTRVDPPGFTDSQLNPNFLRVIPGAVSQIAWGKFVSPDYMVHPGEYIPPVGTRTGTPGVQEVNEIYFHIALPSGPKPAGGWPVAIWGAPGNKHTLHSIGASLAHQGVASIAIDSVGNGLGSLSMMTVQPQAGDPVTFSVGGRGRDQNNDNLIASDEGGSATRPRAILSWADGIRQTAADWMQLVRVIQVGMDVDGDGARDLNPAHISYFGASVGGIFGPAFVAVEPDVRSAVLVTGGGGGSSSIFALAALNRPSTGAALNARVPSLLNPVAAVRISEMELVPIGTPRFHENLPLRDGVPLHVRMQNGTAHTIQSPVVNTVDGAIAIQQYLENQQWASLSGDPLGYARHLRRDPLPGMPAKSVLFVFAKGDQQIPNATTTALIRAGDLADRTTFYRHDVAFAEHPTLPRNPHFFASGLVLFGAVWAPIGLEPQRQVATFLASDGKTILHPEPKHYYEVPVKVLPEGLNYLA